MNNEYDQFIGKVTQIGNYFSITIPIRTAKFAGLKKGDEIKVWFTKNKPVNENNNVLEGDVNDNL